MFLQNWKEVSLKLRMIIDLGKKYFKEDRLRITQLSRIVFNKTV